MRKVLLILILVFLSCEKDSPNTFCWYCETSAIEGGVIIKTEIDNMTPEEIIIYGQGLSSGLEHCIKGTMQTICTKKEGY